ncbi:branched-chain amino acid ABC transporter permease [Chloroflexota bacterium]
MKRITGDLRAYIVISLIYLILPVFLYDNSLFLHILIMCLVWGVVAASWDLVMGYAGIFSFGQLAFFTLGAYTTGLLTIHLGISTWLGILAAGAVTALIGALMGLLSLRLKGVYIGLVTFALHLVLVPLIRVNLAITGGATGLLGIPSPSIGGFTFESVDKVPWYFMMLAIASILAFVIYRLIHSPVGLAFTALRDSESFAKSLGVNDYKYMVLVFTVTSALTGIIGAFYAHYVGIVSPRILGLDQFLLVMIMVIVGGMGRFPGAIIAAPTFVIISELLRPLGVYRLIIFGAMVIIAMIFLPQGLMGVIDSVSASISRTFKGVGKRT